MGYSARTVKYRTCTLCRQEVYANAVEFALHVRACKSGLILPQLTRGVTIRHIADDDEDWQEA